MSQQATCHPLCLRSDPRRVILCNCNCRGTRHGERWVEENGFDEIRKYYSALQAKFDRWEINSRKRALKIRSLKGGLAKRRAAG